MALAAYAESPARTDRWSAFFLPDGRGTVERGGYGEAPELALGLRADGDRWVFESAATQRVFDDALARGAPAELIQVYDDPWLGPRRLEFLFDPIVIDGDRIGVVVHCAEVTGRDAQARAARLQARVLETMGEGVLLVDAQARVLMANPAAEMLLAPAGGTLVGMDLASFGAEFARCVRGLPVETPPAPEGGTRFELVRGDGAAVSVSCTMRALEGERAGVVVLRNLAERRRFERELVDTLRLERERIARDLHDGVGQELTAVALLLRGLAQWLKRDRADASEEIDRVVQLVNGVIGGTRSMAQGLHEAPAVERDLAKALTELARARTALVGPAVEFVSTLARAPQLEPRVVQELVRIVQEAIANALRHSGAAHIWIRLSGDGERVLLAVEDDGCGISPESATHGGMGIGIMRFRAHAIGAELELGAREGGGTRVACVVRRG